MKKTIAFLLSAVLLVSMLSIAVSAASWKNESDWTVNEDGTVAFPNAYGYVFDIDYVNGTIAGEDATMIDNADSYASCNPNWAISVALAETETEGMMPEKHASHAHSQREKHRQNIPAPWKHFRP